MSRARSAKNSDANAPTTENGQEDQAWPDTARIENNLKLLYRGLRWFGKRMNLNVPVDLHNSFKSVTAGQGTTMTDDEQRHGEERRIRT